MPRDTTLVQQIDVFHRGVHSTPGGFRAMEIANEWSEEIEERLRPFQNLFIEVGVFSDAGRVAGESISMAQLMWMNEFGLTIPVTDDMRGFLFWKFGIWIPESTQSIHIPERAPLRISFDRNVERLEDVIRRGIEDVVAGKRTPRQVAAQVGQSMEFAIVRVIKSGLEPPLTFRAGGTPLIDDGELIRHIDSRVRDRRARSS